MKKKNCLMIYNPRSGKGKVKEKIDIYQRILEENNYEVDTIATKGMGYATEAVTAFLPVMAERVGASEVYGIRLQENAASGRVLEKCGFTVLFEGEGPYHGGTYKISKSVWRNEDKVFYEEMV